MLIDGRTLENQQVQTDVCIIGAGAAGIAIASEFFDSSIRVTIIESGGSALEKGTQQLYDGKTTGMPYSLINSRLRYLGGSTNHWEGMCAPLDRVDFEKRNWIKNSGWPIKYDDLQEHYVRAARFLNLSGTGNTDFSTPSDLLSASEDFSFGAWRHAHTLTPAEIFSSRIRRQQNIRLVLNSNLTAMHTTDNQEHITSIQLQTLEGQKFSVNAQYFILACGGIENARLLLACTKQTRDTRVGKYFMEHPRFEMGKLFTFNNPAVLRPFEQYIGMEPLPDKIYTITPNANAMKTLSMLNCSVVLRDIQQQKKPPAIAKYIANFFGRSQNQMWSTTLFARVEHEPSTDNKITLSDDTDALGMPTSKLHLTLGETEWNTTKQFALLLAKYFGSQGIGVIKLSPWLGTYKGWPKNTLWSYHHMGTTRMSETRQNGVVDANCKMHGMDNLFIAGSSVFPTSGWANPTYTIVALSIKLADNLKKILVR